MAFFIITITLIVCAVYVDFQGLPQKRQRLFEQQFANHRTEMQVQQQFVQQMESARIFLDSFGKSGKNKFQVEAGLDGKLNDMEKLKQRDTSINGKLDQAILNAFLELRDLKKEMESHQTLVARVDELENLLNECRQSLLVYKTQAQQPIVQ
jgi:hypothetical protein